MTKGDAICSLAPLIEISLDYEAEAHATNPDHLSLSVVKKNRHRIDIERHPIENTHSEKL